MSAQGMDRSLGFLACVREARKSDLRSERIVSMSIPGRPTMNQQKTDHFVEDFLADVPAVRTRLEMAAAITSRLAHDFGNYLTGILGFTELGLSQATADTPQHRYLQEVLQSAQQGAAWIHRLQLFCRRNAGPSWPTRLATVL